VYSPVRIQPYLLVLPNLSPAQSALAFCASSAKMLPPARDWKLCSAYYCWFTKARRRRIAGAGGGSPVSPQREGSTHSFWNSTWKIQPPSHLPPGVCFTPKAAS